MTWKILKVGVQFAFLCTFFLGHVGACITIWRLSGFERRWFSILSGFRGNMGSKRIRFGNFVVWFQCASLWTMLAILVIALQSRYWISPGINNRELCNLILFGISSDLSCVVWFPLTSYVHFVHVTVGSSRTWTSIQLSF
ncbi:hypothetical protein MTR67_001922 [Solanum verrucosum]|uniref:Uncharacterized protein n=1 Tax=Solanum verrucosum TaxID=315347 RepID=A0AAF0PQ21_SOLVR|nr:hypothetical protein MTR67_001922 [Solanum verrucosum]